MPIKKVYLLKEFNNKKLSQDKKFKIFIMAGELSGDILEFSNNLKDRISNLKLNVVETMKNHPIRKLFNKGIRCTLNTDDPLSFGNQLEEEYAALAMELNFSKKELAILARNGFEIALMPESMTRPFIKQIDAIIGSY
mgnify:CR=1 FL=1